MTLTELPWLFFGRRIRPYALFVSLATLTVAWTLLVLKDGPGQLLDQHSLGGVAIGVTAVISFLLLHAGFWFKEPKFLETGMLLSAGVWMGRAFFIGLDQGFFVTGTLLSFCWAGASIGSFLLEVTTGDHPVRRAQ